MIADRNTTVTGAEALYQLGRAQQLAGRCNEGVVTYASVKLRFGVHESFVARALLESSRCYTSLGNTAEARKLLEQVSDQYSNTEAGREAARILRNE
jgi:TolA-binding protein